MNVFYTNSLIFIALLALAVASTASVTAVRSKVRKCCDKGMAFDRNNNCVRADQSKPFKVPKFVFDTHFEEYNEREFTISYQKPDCINGAFQLLPLEDKDDSFKVSLNGMLQDRSGNNMTPAEKYCLEQLIDHNFVYSAIVCVRDFFMQ